MSSSLAIKAGYISILGKLFGRCVDFVTLTILARLLGPEDFGLTAIAMMSVSIAEAALELPLFQVLVREPVLTEDMLHTAFTLSLLRGLALAVVLGGFSVFASQFYHDPRLTALTFTLSLAPILRGSVNPRMVIFIRNFDFRRDVALELTGKVASLVISCSVAWTTHSYWAIATATITTPLTMNLLSYFFAPYRPRLSLSQWKIFRSFVSWGSLSQLLSAVNWQADRLMLGYLIPQASLGQYTQASGLSEIPLQALVVPLARPSLTAFAAKRDSPDALARTYLMISNTILGGIGPVLVSLSLLASSFVAFVLGSSWEESGRLLTYFALFGVVLLPVCQVGSLAIAVDRARMLTFRMIGELVFSLPTVVIGGLYFGIRGTVFARGVAVCAVLIIGMLAVRTMIPCSISQQIVNLRRTVAALAVMAAVELALRPLIGAELTVRSALMFALVILCGFLAYVICLFSLWVLERRPAGLEQLVRDTIERLFTQIIRRFVPRRR